MTFLEALEASLLRAASSAPDEAERPAAILWTDAASEWKPFLPLLLARLPQFLVLGPYDPARRTGPAIWIKCAVAQVLENPLEVPRLPKEAVPVVYLPGVSRQTLRAAADCPKTLQPLVELQYRGAVWTQRNGKDWTVEAFLVSGDALGLDVAKDARTREALLGALPKLAEVPLSELRGRRLEADDFDRLLIGDPARDLLRWMDDPRSIRKNWSEETWRAFRSRCRSNYGFDPEKDGELSAGQKLGMRAEKPWRDLWERYAEAPGLYAGIPDLLDRSKPQEMIFEKDAWPGENQAEEDRLRDALLQLTDVAEAEGRNRIADFEREHGQRRKWVWAKLGRSPLAKALEFIAILAEKTAAPLGGDSPGEMAKVYASEAYLVDDAAIRAMASVRSADDARAAGIAIRSVYLPWLSAACELFQSRMAESPLPGKAGLPAVEVGECECILFVDGLRFDLGRRLAAALEERGILVAESLRWAALPTVTATAKPAVSPVAEAVTGGAISEDFVPALAASGEHLTTDRFRRMLRELGYAFLEADERGDPGAQGAMAWTEFDGIDRRGHDLNEDLARILDDTMERLIERVTGLAEAGWNAVRVVTDHGWLLMPGGLPACHLPGHLLECRWSRCALVKGNSRVGVPRFPWHWNAAEEFAAAPGCTCFSRGHSYAHGGASLQECLLLDLRVSRGAAKAPRGFRIKDIQWIRLRCRVALEPAVPGLQIDIRRKAGDPQSSVIAAAKPADGEGRASVIVKEEDLAGQAAVIVVLDGEGQIVATRPTILGGEV